MKYLIAAQRGFLFVLAFCFSWSSLAVEINSLEYLPETDQIKLGVRYSGGLLEHSFDLRFGRLMETWPYKCTATLYEVQGADDPAEAIIHEDLFFDVSSLPKPTILAVQSASDATRWMRVRIE